jgi:hypothetical protein
MKEYGRTKAEAPPLTICGEGIKPSASKSVKSSEKKKTLQIKDKV